MLKKINRKKFLSAYPNFPHALYHYTQYFQPTIYNSYILQVEAQSTRGLCSNLVKELSGLMHLMKYPSLNFLGDTTTPWLYRKHDYPPVQQALEYLKAQKISRTFNGAILVPNAQLTEFTKHLFWLVRCNGVIFYPHFSDANFNIIGTICQYGNLHLNTLTEEADSAFHQVLEQTKFILTDKSSCVGRIYKRQSTYMAN